MTYRPEYALYALGVAAATIVFLFIIIKYAVAEGVERAIKKLRQDRVI